MTARQPASEKPRPVRGFSFLGSADARLALALGVPLGVLYVLGILSFSGRLPLTDEADHYAQIALFLRGRWEAWPALTTIPGYHAATASLMRIAGAGSLDAARWIGAAYGLIAIAGFHALRRSLWPGTETLATAQFAVLPILAPLFFLVYTDVLALALLLWAAWAAVAGRRWLSALLLTLLVGVRQHEIVWVGLIAPLAVSSSAASPPVRLARAAREALPFLLPTACFVAFWVWNGSVSLSRTQSALHPDFSLHLGNVCFAVLVAGLLLPLHAIEGFRGFVGRVRAHAWLAMIPVSLAAAFWIGFRADNPYNAVQPSYYLHNGFASLLGQSGWRAAAACVFAVAGCGLALVPLRPRAAWTLWPVAAMFLAASWLVELRYAMVPLALWLALRKPLRAGIEYATLALWAVLAVLLCHGTATHRLFL